MKDEYDFSHAKRGAVLGSPRAKTRITIRIHDDVIEWFRQAAHDAGGGNYQTMMNEALRDFIDSREREPLETTLRRVIREEMPMLRQA